MSCMYQSLVVSVLPAWWSTQLWVNPPLPSAFYKVFWSCDQLCMHTKWVPMWVCFEWWLTKHFWQSMEHFTALLCLNFIPTSGHFTFNQSDFMKQVLGSWLSWRSSIFKQKVHQLIKKLQTSNIHQRWALLYISIVILNVVDHSIRLELNNRLNCNFIHLWHVLKCETQFHHGHPLLPSFKNSSLMNSNSHFKAKQQVPLYLALLKLKYWHLEVRRSNSHLQPGVVTPMCENTVHCFHFTIFTPNCKCHLA